MNIVIILAVVGTAAAVIAAIIAWLERRDRKAAETKPIGRVSLACVVARPSAPPEYLIGNGGAERMGFKRRG